MLSARLSTRDLVKYGLVTSSVWLLTLMIYLTLSIFGVTVSADNISKTPDGFNPYIGGGADLTNPEVLNPSGTQKGAPLIVSLDNDDEGAPFLDLNSSNSGVDGVYDFYGSRLMGSNDSSLAIVGSSYSNNNIFTKYKNQFWGIYSNNTLSTSNIADNKRLVRSTKGSRVEIKDPYWSAYWSTSDSSTEIKSGIATEKLLEKDSSGRYGFESVVDKVSQANNTEIWCTLSDMYNEGSLQDVMYSKWFKNSISTIRNTASMSVKDKQIQSIHYLDMLMSLYSVSKGTAAESEWRNAIILYLNSDGGGKLGLQSNNKTNVVLSRGLIWGTKKTEAVSNEDFLTVMNAADLISYLYRIDASNDVRNKSAASYYFKQSVVNTRDILKNAFNKSRVNGLKEGYWRDNKYWNELLGYLVTKDPEDKTITSGTFKALEDISISTSKGTHQGLEVIMGLPMETYKKSQDAVVTAYWGNSVDGLMTDTTRVIGNVWHETDNNKMFNKGNSNESETLRFYLNGLGNWHEGSDLLGTIGNGVTVSINGKLNNNVDVSNIIDNNDKFKVKIELSRTANNSAGIAMNAVNYMINGKGYTNNSTVDLSYLGWNKDNLRRFLLGQQPFNLIEDDSTQNQKIANGSTTTLNYKVYVTVYYGTKDSGMSEIRIGGQSNNITAKRIDYPVKAEGIQHTSFHSKPKAYAEIKEGTVQTGSGTSSNETWEAMAGVPSTETLYFAAGGSEFILELHMSYIPKERSRRYYHSQFSGTACEYKEADRAGTYSESGYTGGNDLGWIANQGNSGGGGANVIPTINKNFGGGDASVQSESYTFNVHTGGQISVTIGGTIHNDAPAVVAADGMGDVTANNPHKSRPADMQSRVAAYQALTKWTQEVANTSIYYTASSDNVTRQIKLGGNGCSISLPARPANEPADTSASDGHNSHDEGEPPHEVLDPAHAEAEKGADVTWTVTATVRIPAHVICGPCCEHDLPAIEDNWTQIAEYSYMRIDSVKTWKIDRAYVDGMSKITYTKQDNVVADMVQGDPNIYYFIGDENRDYYNESKQQLDYYQNHGEIPDRTFAEHVARAGRVVYSLEPDQYDSVGWNEGTRSNRCNGDQGCFTRCSTNPFRVSAGSGRKNIKNTQAEAKGSSGNSNCNKNDQKGQVWSCGALYTNTNRTTNDETWWYHHVRGDKISGATTNNTIDRYDMETPEVLRFKHRRELWNYITVVSDFLILQTTQGDEVAYYNSSVQWRCADNNFDYDADAAASKNAKNIGSDTTPYWHRVYFWTDGDAAPGGAMNYGGVYKTIIKMDDNLNVSGEIPESPGASININQPHELTIYGYNASAGANRDSNWGKANNKALSHNNDGYGEDYLKRTFDQMWTDYKIPDGIVASKWDITDEIPVSGYNGKFNSPLRKFSSLSAGGDTEVIHEMNGKWVHDETINDFIGLHYNNDGSYGDQGDGIVCIKMIPDIDSCAVPDLSGLNTRRYSSENVRDSLIDKTGNNLVVKPTDGHESRFIGIQGSGSPMNVINYSYRTVNYESGHYVNADFDGVSYSNGKWSKGIGGMDSKNYQYKVTQYKSSPYTTSSSSQSLDGAHEDIGSTHAENRIRRPNESLKIFTDRVHPWPVQNGWEGDKKTYEHGIRQDATNENGEYATGNAYVFYRQILDYTRPSMEDGNTNFQYDHSNSNIAALGNKSGVAIKAVYSDGHDKVNNIVVQDPVSLEEAFLIGLDEERDQRSGGSNLAVKLMEDLEASKVCPGTAALCEYRHLNCKYFDDVVLGTFNVSGNKLVNTKTGRSYSMPSGFSVSEGGVKLGGVRLSIPFSELNYTYNASSNIQVEFSAKIPQKVNNTFMLVSFKQYDLFNTDWGTVINTGRGNEKGVPNNYRDNLWHKYKVIFNMDTAESSKLYIDDMEVDYKTVNTSNKLSADMVGTYFNIGCWNLNDNYGKSNAIIKDLKITKLAARGTHVSSCYKTEEVHSTTIQYVAIPKKFNYTGGVQYYTVPETGYYRIDAYGASGGDNLSGVKIAAPSAGGLGGYASGEVYLLKGQRLSIYVGGQGGLNKAGWNGGGTSANSGYGGGGASDVRAARVFTLNDKMREGGSDAYVRGGHITYGPYITVPSGTYNVTIYGAGLNDSTIVLDVMTNNGVSYGRYIASNGSNTGLNNLSVSYNKISYSVNISKNIAEGVDGGGLEFRVFHNGRSYRFDRIEVSSSDVNNRIIVAGGGGGADNAGGVLNNNDDGSGGYGGGLTGGNPKQNGTRVGGLVGTQNGGYALASGQGRTDTDAGGGGGGYFGGKAGTDGNTGGGGGSSYISSVRNGYTTYGVRKGDGQVVITALDPENSPESERKVVSSINNKHVHKESCVVGTSEAYKQNAALIGAFYQDAQNDSSALRALLGNTVYNLYKSSSYNQTDLTGRIDFGYSASAQKLTAKSAGNYTFDVYGASGGGNSAGHESAGGLGGRVTASKYLNAGETVYIYTGQAGGGSGGLGSNWTYGPYMGGGKGGPGGFDGGGMTLVSTSPNESIKSGNRLYTTTEEYQEMSPTAGTIIGQDDDGGDGLSSSMTVYLQANTKYLVCVGAYSDYRHGSYPWGISGPGGSMSGTDYVDQGAWKDKSYDPDCVHLFIPTVTGNYYVWANANGQDPCTYVTTYATITKTRTVTKVQNTTTGTFTPSKALIIAGGGGGADNTDYSGTVQGGQDDGSGGAGGSDGNIGNPLVNGARQSGLYASYVQGAGESTTANTDTGGGGAGWYGGKSTNNNNGGAGGGSNYTGSGVTLAAQYSGVNSGNGKVIVTYASEADLQKIYNAIVNIVAKNVDKIPSTVNGAKNPVFICDGTYNTHVCDSRCKVEKHLTCSDPHHKNPAEHYPGSNPICWEPCGYTDPNDPNNPHAHHDKDIVVDGVTKKAGKFLNIDYGFQVYFPNTGDFEDDPDLRGIGAVTQVKGMSYKNNMDTTKWLREKRIKFGYDVLFYNPTTGKWEEYKANTWIPLPILKDSSKFDTDYSEFSSPEWFKQHALEVYDFYVTMSNVDIAGARYDFEIEAVNAEHSAGGKSAIYTRKVVNRTEERNIDNVSTLSNSARNNALSAKHSASKHGFVDIVGRIGNLLITDTDDIRFANLFKLPVEGTWLIDGVVKGVNSGIQNNYLSWHNNSDGRWLDIRGVQVTPERGMYNTWMTENWAEDKDWAASHGSIIGSKDVPLPLTSDKNNVTQLLADMFKPGYNILYEISTLGSYSDNLQVIPYFYALDTKTNKLYPIDVYMKEEDEYVPINYYDVLPKTTDSESEKAKKQKLIDEEHKYVLSLDWDEEKERRNYTTQEKLITNYITDHYNYIIDNGGTRHKLNSPDTIVGTGHALGTIQLINADQYARTFIGSTYTRGENFNATAVDDSNTGVFSPISVGGGTHYTNLDNIIYRDRFWTNAQRWHLKLGLPSTAVFIKYDKDGIRHLPTEELVDESGNPIIKDGGEHKLKFEELQDKRYAIIMTAEIYAYGDTYTLKYDQKNLNGKAKIGNRTYTFGTNYNGQEIKGTIMAVYDAEGSSDLDVTIRGSH